MIKKRDGILNYLDSKVSRLDISTDDDGAKAALKELMLNNVAFDLLQLRKDMVVQDARNVQMDSYESYSKLYTSDASAQRSRLHKLTRQVQDSLFEIDSQLQEYKQQHDEELKESRAPAASLDTRSDPANIIDNAGNDEEDSMAVLRKRLLSTTRSSQLDNFEDQNKYHESLHEDYLKDISSFVAQAKSTALSFQQALTNDATILKEATEELEKSQGKLSTVGRLLTSYHRSGKLSIWFYIRLILGLFVSFFICIMLIQILPRG